MKVGILGSGLMGAKLGTLFARAGHEVIFSYARSVEKLKKLAKEAGAAARPGTPRDAVEQSDVLLVAVNWWNVDDLLQQAGDLSGKVVLTCSLAMKEDNSALEIGLTSSAAEALAKKIPKAHLVSAFNTVPSEVFFDVFEARNNKANRPSLVYCGDDEKAKKVAVQLIGDVGFDPVDAGPLRIARYTEPFALLMGQLAYEAAEGPEIAYRIQRY